MSGIDAHGYLHQLALHMNELQTREQIESVLNEVEPLFEQIPADLQDEAETLIALLHDRLAILG